MNVTIAYRIRAVLEAFIYGILPWWLYERTCHYKPELGYWSHLYTNLLAAARWISGKENYLDAAYQKLSHVEKVHACEDTRTWEEKQRQQEESEQRRIKRLEEELEELRRRRHKREKNKAA